MLFYYVLFLAAYLPFQVALSPAPGIDLASIRVLILLAFFLWLANGLKNKKLSIRFDWQTALILIFLFLNAFSIFFARNSLWGERKLLFLLSVFPIYFAASDILNTEEKRRKTAFSLVLSGAAAAAVGILQFLSQFMFGVAAVYHFWARYGAVPFLGKTFSETVLEYPSWLVNVSGHTYFRAISVFPDPHMFSLFLGILLPIAVFLFITERKNIWLACASLIFLADILTFSRGAYLGLAAAVLASIFLAWPKLSSRYRAAFFIGIFVLVLVFLSPNPVSSRFFSSFNPEEGSNAGRLAMWKAAGENILEHPVIGVGLGNFPLAIDPLASYREPIYAHNTYLDIAVEAGIFASLAWIGFLFLSLRSFLRKAKKNKLYSGFLLGLLIFSVHSIVETGLYSPTVLTLLLIVASFSERLKKDEKIS